MNQLEEFKALGLSDDILTAIAKKGFETPSAIQSLTIPHLLTTDKDIIAQAQTGTGKTAAFGLPIIQMLTSRRNIPQAIVLVPTRELALQVTQELISFNTHDLSIAPIYGGASMTEQLRRLKKGIDIVAGARSTSRRSPTWCSTRRTKCSTWVSSRISKRSCTP